MEAALMVTGSLLYSWMKNEKPNNCFLKTLTYAALEANYVALIAS